MRTRARTDTPPEKVVQAQIVTLLESLGAQVYVLGTRRPRGDHPGTCQTAGLPDLYAFLPRAPLRRDQGATAVWIEVKAARGRETPTQFHFRASCGVARLNHVLGGLNDLIVFLVAGGWLKADSVPHYRRPPAVLEEA